MRQNNRIQSFINFLFFSHKYGTFTESSKTDPYNLSHDTWRRELIKIKDPQQLLWDKVKHLLSPKKGDLVADIIDKPRGKTIACVGFHHCGKHSPIAVEEGFTFRTGGFTMLTPLFYRVGESAGFGSLVCVGFPPTHPGHPLPLS